MLAISTSAFAGGNTKITAKPTPQYIEQTNSLIVKYATPQNATIQSEQISTLRAQALTSTGQHFGLSLRTARTTATGAQVMKLDKKVSLSEAASIAAELKKADPSIEYAEPDQFLHILATPNDTYYSRQWDLYESTGGLRADTAWASSTGTGVVVAVIDTGYRPHADLAANIVAGYDFISDTTVANDGGGRDSSPLDPGDWTAANECYSGSPASNSSWHGTHVAGTIAAITNNAKGVAGIAYGAKVQPVRALGKCGGLTSDIADAITWASGGTVTGVPANATPARVINMSLGGSGTCSTTLQRAITSARSRNTVVVVAAGNENTNASSSNPANCSGVVTVAATDRYGSRAPYSNYGSIVTVAAPGGDMSSAATDGILSTLNSGTTTPGTDNYAYYQGTSMATPHVAAAVALILAKAPTLTPDQVKSILTSTARSFPGTCSGCGAGIVDATAAVAAAK
ncbi:S8 family peptidase [Uliginosibacterium gangwonense]|uniref:S8 family peptidase n=1 Tax=Uliginosibacterium gangwonense TaxID=392736 RepID=UPI0003739679|nr:S8 family peptidase [Uliginosibacterium gangwonense]